MFYIGIDVSKDKHDCTCIDSDGEIHINPFSFSNNLDGFELCLSKLKSVDPNLNNFKVALEATGHYSYNILGYLLEQGLQVYLLNPLHTSLFKKSLTLRRTKTDRVDSKVIALMLISNTELKPFSISSYNNLELKSLSRYLLDKINYRARLKMSVSRLVTILFPELESLVSSLHMPSVYALLSEFPGASYIANAHITKLTNRLTANSKGKFGRQKAECIRNAAKSSIGTILPAKSLELKHTIKDIENISLEINEIDAEIAIIMQNINPPIISIPGVSTRMAALIISEIGDFNNFSSPDKILAFAGLSPSTYQSGKVQNAYPHMEKRGSRYLRYALYNATKFVCKWSPVFSEYLEKKRAEGKHYNVAISHAAKKLVRVMYHLQISGELYEA